MDEIHIVVGIVVEDKLASLQYYCVNQTFSLAKPAMYATTAPKLLMMRTVFQAGFYDAERVS